MSASSEPHGDDISGILVESVSSVDSDGRRRLIMLATTPEQRVVVWTYTLNADWSGTGDDLRHEFASWDALWRHFADGGDAALIRALLARCGKSDPGGDGNPA